MKCVWVMMMFLHSAFSQLEKFEVKGPGGPVLGTAGSDVILPCSIKPLTDQTSKSAVDRSIKWTRPDLGDQAVVHFYENHRDSNSGQIVYYRERTALFTTELQNGNTSLRLTKVNLFDEGEYKCQVDSEVWSDDVSFALTVEVVGTRPVITVEKYDKDSEMFSLLCESKGWRPQPDLQWLNSNRNSLTAGVIESQRDTELFSVTRRLTVSKSDIDTFFCRATLRHHTKEDRITAATLVEHLPRPPIAEIVAGVLAPVIIILIVAAGLYIRKAIQRRKEVQELEKEIPRLNETVVKLEKEIQSLNEEVQELEAVKQRLNGKAGQPEAVKLSLNEEVQELEAAKQRLNGQVVKLEAAKESFSGKVKKLEKVKQRLNGKAGQPEAEGGVSCFLKVKKSCCPRRNDEDFEAENLAQAIPLSPVVNSV